MSGAIPWKLLQRQYFSDSVYEDELIHHIESPEAVSSRIVLKILAVILCMKARIIHTEPEMRCYVKLFSAMKGSKWELTKWFKHTQGYERITQFLSSM